MNQSLAPAIQNVVWDGVALLLAFGLAACQTPAGRSAGAEVGDGTIFYLYC